MQQLKKTTFLKNAVILTATGLVLRAAGMLFRIYVAAQIGDEGMGLYQLIFTLYNLTITLASAGASVAVTRLVAARIARKEGGEAQLSRRLVGYALAGGCLAGAAQFLLAEPAASLWLGDARAALSLKILSPSLPVIAVGAALRGYFMARRQVATASRAQIFEQIVRIASVALLLGRVLDYGVEYACAAVVAGNTISEIASCLWVYLGWERDLRRIQESKKAPQRGGLLREYAGIVLPITATRGISSLLVTVENILVPARLALFLGGYTEALAQFGRLKGMAMPVLFFPFSLLSALSILLLPEITQAHSTGNRTRLQALCRRTVGITAILSVLAGGLFAIFAEPLGQLLYQSEEIGFYIGVLAPLMPFLYLESMVDGILKGVGEQLSTFRYSVCDSVLRILLVLALVPRFGMKGFLFMMLCSNLFTSLLNFRRMLVVTDTPPDWMGWVVKPILSIIGAWTGYRALAALIPHTDSLILTLIWGGGVVAVLYLLLVWATGCGSPKMLRKDPEPRKEKQSS